MRAKGFTLVELIVAMAVALILAGVAAPAVWGAYKASSLAVSASNIRQLSAGAAAYLGDNNYCFWPYQATKEVRGVRGTAWWFGFESFKSRGLPEGERTVDMESGPLGPYLPHNIAPDPSFRFAGKPFKPKYSHGYIGIGYNVLLAGNTGWLSSSGPPLRYWNLENPGKTVVFATAAQINSFQKPASFSNPMIEEFYGFDDDVRKIPSVHFRHHGHAMVAYANGAAELVPMDEKLMDKRAPEACVGHLPPEMLR